MLRKTALCGLMIAALILPACDSSSDDDTSDTTQGVVLADATQGTTAGAWLAVQAALHQMEPGTYEELDGPPAVTASGDSMSGNLVIDFGTGTVINGTEFIGVIAASYTRSNDTGSVTADLDNLELQGSYGTVDVSGILTITTTLNNNDTADGTITGDVTLVRGSRTIEIENIAIDYVLDGTTGVVTIPDGDADIDDTVWGAWEVDIDSLLAQVVNRPRTINDGDIVMDRVDFPQVTVTLDFESPNAGDATLDPGGITTSFSF